MYHWIRAASSDFSGIPPQPRSGHTAVSIGKSKVVVFGGLREKTFLKDTVVYDIDNNLWFEPECTGNGSDGEVGPCSRAFHVAVAIDCHMFIFGGRAGSKRLGDFWVLDTDVWQWSELTSFGDLPSPRDFVAASAVGNRKIVMYGGWDGKKWMSDVYILDTISLEWTELSVSGPLPPPRCGHSATMLEKRLLVFGGRGGGGPIMSDLWALKGLIDEENEAPGWTQLKLPGQSPSARCGHTVTSGGHNLLVFGGHGTGGWLSRYDIYHNDCIVLDRVSVQWKRLSTNNEPPAARAYHTLTCIGSRYLLIGGFDGKTTFDDIWWLVPEDDPIARRLSPTSPPNNNDIVDALGEKEIQSESSVVSDLAKKLEISISPSGPNLIVNEMEDAEFLNLASQVIHGNGANDMQILKPPQAVQELRDHWKKSSPRSIRLKELGPLLRDYQRLIERHHLKNIGLNLQSVDSKFPRMEAYHFYHVKSVSQLRMDDIPKLLAEYKQLLSY